VSGAAFEHVLEFIYTRKCSLPLDLLQPVLEAACRLQCAELQQAAEAAVITHLSPSTCLDAWDFADHFSLTPLTAAAKRIAIGAFEEVSTSSTFSTMPAARLDELLGDDALAVKDEETTLRALESWFRAQHSPPESSVTEGLLSHVRFPLMKQESRRGLEASPLVQRHPMVLVSAYREELLKEKTPRNRKRKLMTGQPLTYEELKVGMHVRVMEDMAFVKSECDNTAPGATQACGWDDEMSSCLGNEYVIVEVEDSSTSALLKTRSADVSDDYFFPSTSLLTC